MTFEVNELQMLPARDRPELAEADCCFFYSLVTCPGDTFGGDPEEVQ